MLTQYCYSWYQPVWCVDSILLQLISTSLVCWLNTVIADINQPGVLTHLRITGDINKPGVFTHQRITADINQPGMLTHQRITADINQSGVLTQYCYNWYQPVWCVDSILLQLISTTLVCWLIRGIQLISTRMVCWLNTVTADINQPCVLTQYCYSWYQPVWCVDSILLCWYQPVWCVDSILLQLISTSLVYWLIIGLQLISTSLLFWLIWGLQLISTSLVCWLNTVIADINQSGVLTQYCYSWYQSAWCVDSILL